MTDPTETISRRTLTGLAAAGVSLPLLAACGSDDSGSTAAEPAGDTSASASTSTSGSASASASGSASAAAPSGLTSTSDIEVGGGKIFADDEVVITQPTEGDFKCFSAICTHQGCIVASVSGGTINCECHGSQFSIDTGEPESGPASSPLDSVPITVSGDQISLT